VVSFHRPVLAAVLAALGIATWWLAQWSEPEEPPGGAPPGHVPDYYVVDLRGRTMDESGRLSRSLRADRLTHFMDDQSTEVEAPRLTLFRAGEPPWEIESERGWISPDGTVTLLQGAARLTRDAAPGIRPVEVVTSNLLVRPKDDYAETAEAVQITSSNSRAQSVGMQAWLGKPSRIKLLSQARGHYEIEKSP
jgi:lipopolysaccharide export system protein LptC